jgi:hypothetical protein
MQLANRAKPAGCVCGHLCPLRSFPRSARSRRSDGRALVTQRPAVMAQPDIFDRGLTADPTNRIVVMDGIDRDRHRVVEDGSWIIMDRHGGEPYPHLAFRNANGPTTSAFTWPGRSDLEALGDSGLHDRTSLRSI